MIDSTTLPKTLAGQYVHVGDLFEVKGRNFNSWPSEIVCSFNSNNLRNDNLPSAYLMKLVERTNVKLVFQVTRDNNYEVEHIWRYFASPNYLPRQMLQYRTSPNDLRNLNISEEIEEDIR